MIVPALERASEAITADERDVIAPYFCQQQHRCGASRYASLCGDCQRACNVAITAFAALRARMKQP